MTYSLANLGISPQWSGAVLTLLVGAAAGFANVSAGGGSLLTLPLLVLMGLEGPVANGTNRVALIVQNLVAVPTFRRGGVRGLRTVLPLAAVAIPMAGLGAWLATGVDDTAFRRILAVVMMAMAVITVLRAPRPDEREKFERLRPSTYVAFALIGLYAGFIQAGVGFLIVFALSGLERFSLLRCHAFKVAAVLVMQLTALPIFILADLVDWKIGLFLAIGLAAGGWLGARFTLASHDRTLRIVLALASVLIALRLIFS